MTEMEITIAYNLYNQFISKSAPLGFVVSSEEFSTDIKISGSICSENFPALETMLQEIGNGRISLTIRQ